MLPITLCASRENLPPRPTVGSDSRISPQRYKRASYVNRLVAKRGAERLTADGWRVYSPAHPTEAPCRGSFGGKPCLWVSCHPESADLACRGWGLRFYNFSDEIISGRGGIDHQGWFTDSDGCRGVYRGAVVLFPHGWAAPAVWDSESESLAICLDLAGEWEERQPGEDDCQYDTADYIKTAARSADHWAERAAETARDWNDKQDRAIVLAERLTELDALGQFADGSRLSAYNESERETLLTLEALSKEFMKPCVETTKRGKYRARLSASGYLDCTEWGASFSTIARAYAVLADQWGDGVEIETLEDIDLIDDPDCVDHFPHPRADELLNAEQHRQQFDGVGHYFIGFRDGANGLEIVRGDDGASVYFQPCSDELREVKRAIAARGIDSVGADYTEVMTLPE